MAPVGQELPFDRGVANPIRFRGHRGGIISMHRALTRFHLRPINLAAAISLFLFFSSIWVALLPSVLRFWTSILAFGLRFVPMQVRLETVSHHFRFLTLTIPSLRMEPVLPGMAIWDGTCAVTLLLLTVTFFVSKNLRPATYLLRAILLVQGTALIYFAVWPSRFPHTADSYMDALVASGIGIISVVPLLFGLVYYIFDFGLLRKASLTVLTMAYLSLFLPFQFLLQALILQKSVLFMPTLYIIFGMPIDVLLIIAFYSWGMTWATAA